MENIITIKKIVKSYGMGEGIVHALDGVNLEIAAGELVAVVGASGSGKSTLLHMIGGMDSPTAGSVFFNGKDISKYSKKQKAKYRCENVGIVFQNFKRGKKRIQTPGDRPVSPARRDQRLPAQSGCGLFQLLSGGKNASEGPGQRDDPGSPSSRLFSLQPTNS